jgi:hypothetical protein
MLNDPMERDRCDICERVARLTTCECCGVSYCGNCGLNPEAGSRCDCPNTDCNLSPINEED